MQLNDRQQAVIDTEGHIVAAAPPGSGKTRVLVEKTKQLLKQQPGQIKLVTFTRAAATEMKSRIGNAGRGRVEAATFDSYCLRMAKKAGILLKPPNAVREWNARNVVGRQFGIEDSDELEELMAAARCKLKLDKAPKKAQKVYQAYLKELEEQGAIDFADIARRVVLDLYKGGKIRPLAMDYLLVDEFQDADEIQVAWTIAHAKLGATVMVVGDDDQSIYSWRGGMGYAAMTAIEDQLGATVITLDTCYRCRPEIVEAGRVLIAKNTTRFHKPIITPRPMGGQVAHIVVQNQDHAINEIISIARHFGMPRFAIIGRRNADLKEFDRKLTFDVSPNRKGNGEDGLDHRETPPKPLKIVRLGGKDFWGTLGATMAIELTYVFAEPDPKSSHLAMFLRYILTTEKSQDGTICIQALRERTQIPELDGIVIKGLDALMRAILEYSQRKQSDESDQKAVRAMQVFAETQAHAELPSYDNFVKAIDSMAAQVAKGRSLEDVRKTILNAQSQRKSKDVDGADVVICTMHASKGMEFPLVFIVAANRGIIPTTPKEAGEETEKVPTGKEKALLEEERRLFYVALTRAEDRAYVLSYRETKMNVNKERDTTQDGAKVMVPAEPSPFIEEAEIEEILSVKDGVREKPKVDVKESTQEQLTEPPEKVSGLIKSLAKRVRAR